MTTVQRLNTLLRQREDELQQKDTQFQQKDEEIQQYTADISRLQREIQKLQVGIKLMKLARTIMILRILRHKPISLMQYVALQESLLGVIQHSSAEQIPTAKV